jgi:hypothetical protein
MEENNKQLKSIWGKWWEPIRKWFYPAWLLYELTVRFYENAIAVYNYFIEKQDSFDSYLGEWILRFVLCHPFRCYSARHFGLICATLG